jgi:S-adenosylmethionine:diacylglycerol 3-amino-3-carboxypropyl transferase
MRVADLPTTAWRAGAFHRHAGQLLFGRMYEDPSIELSLFPPRCRLFSIASAGCTARALAAAGHRVTAVDINPVQVEYASARSRGAPAQIGAAERLLSNGRRLLPLIGWGESKRSAFLELSDPTAQLEYWDRTLETPAWRTALDLLLSPALLRLFYRGTFLGALPPHFDAAIRARLRRGWAAHSNRSNPYAWRLLMGDAPADEEPPPAAEPIDFVCAGAAEWLERCPPRSFDAFALSNIADGASPAYIARLDAAVRRAATRGAISVTRTFAEPVDGGAAAWAERDRSLLWGGITVRRIGDN